MKPYRSILLVTAFLMLLGLAGIAFSFWTPQDPLALNLEGRLAAPGTGYICGTDELGRDMLSRILLGFSNTISVAIMTLLTSFGIGVLLGSLAGRFYETSVDRVFNWVAAMLFSLPFLLIMAALMSLMERTLFNAYLVLTAVMWVGPARIVRAGVIRARSSDFVRAERAMGMPERTILVRTLIPASIGPAFVFSFRYFPEIIGMEAGLSFLGLGIQPPHPGLGKMIFDGIDHLGSAWWYAFFPALLLFVTVCLSNLFYRWVSRGDSWG